MPELGWVLAAIALVGVVVLGVLLRRASTRSAEDRASWEKRSRADIASARESAQAAAVALRADAERVLAQAEARAKEEMEDVERRRREMEASISSQRAELREERAAQERRAERLHEREDRVAADAEGLAAKAQRLEVQRTQQRETRDELREERESVALELERVASLTVADAKREIIAEAERQAKLTATQLARTIETTAKRDADRTARGIVVTAIQRVAAEQTSESVVSTVHLPSDEMKGRIIGREGRNIRAFEQITGVNLLIDDTPESVLLSSFDPVRREVARLTLVDLVTDGRIHPARIEEVFERSERQIHERIVRSAEDALLEVGIADLHADLIPTLGALAYRTSYGQ
ncbi:MAG TPA: Rnase Y domain-containing protein, partial [Arachnia sp.]|nr:Rnase Y domain-containing protein [Arachnia sp.]